MQKLWRSELFLATKFEYFVTKMQHHSYASVWELKDAAFNCTQPHFLIEKETMKNLWKAMEDSFIKTRNITYDRLVLFFSKKQESESWESFYGRLIEQAENCSLGDEDITLIRDTLIFNVLDFITHKSSSEKNLTAAEALEMAIHIERIHKTNQR